MNTGSIGFSLAPRINAAGRLERAMQAVEMLTTDVVDRAEELAQALTSATPSGKTSSGGWSTRLMR